MPSVYGRKPHLKGEIMQYKDMLSKSGESCQFCGKNHKEGIVCPRIKIVQFNPEWGDSILLLEFHKPSDDLTIAISNSQVAHSPASKSLTGAPMPSDISYQGQ
jgi:hypothetical protein